jgi:hypothetical protein
MPKRFTIPEYSPPMRELNEKRAEERRARMLRLDALELRQRQKRTRTLARVDRVKMREREQAQRERVPCDPWLLRKAHMRESEAHPKEPPVDGEAASMLAEIDDHDRKMKAMSNQKKIDSSLAGAMSASTIPTGF